MDNGPPVAKVVAASLARRIRWLVPVVYLGCLLSFIADVTVDIFYLPFGILYIPLVCTAVLHRNPRVAWWLAGLASVMVVIGFFLPEIGPRIDRALTNRGLSIAAVVITAVLVWPARWVRRWRSTARSAAVRLRYCNCPLRPRSFEVDPAHGVRSWFKCLFERAIHVRG